MSVPPVAIDDSLSITTDGRDPCQLVRLVLTSSNVVLVVPAPDTDVAANVVDKLSFDKPCVVIAYYVANAPGYRRALWAHNLPSTGPKPDSLVPPRSQGCFSCLTSYVVHESSTLWYSLRYQTQCLCLMFWVSPLLFPCHGHRMHAYPLVIFHTSLCFSRCVHRSNNSEDAWTPFTRTPSVH